MEYGIYAIRDVEVSFGVPFFSHSDQTAVRTFVNVAADPHSDVFKTPADYDLYKIGTYSVLSGQITAEVPHMIMRGVQACAAGLRKGGDD